MKKLLIICIVIKSSLCYGQVKDYFIPSYSEFNNMFEFETKSWENDNGVFNEKRILRYYLDPSMNYKIYSESIFFRYNVPNFKVNSHSFYSIDKEKVTFIYSYVEGITEELRRRGIDNSEHKTVILKYPPSKWQDNTDKDGITYYESSFCKLKTEYADYDDCIVVTKRFKSNTTQFKWAEKFVEKSYYVRNLGLVKTERYENGKLLINNEGTSQLIDNISIYSNLVRKNKEKDESIERERLRDFLLSRRTENFLYNEHDLDYYNLIRDGLTKKISEIIHNYNNDIELGIRINLFVDTLSIVNVSFEPNTNYDGSLNSQISDFLKSIDIRPIIIDGYVVNSSALFDIEIYKVNGKFSVKYTGEELNFITGMDYNKYKDLEREFLKDIVDKKMPKGHYELSYMLQRTGNYEKKEVKYLDYKSFSGPSSAFASILVPGLGNRFVSGGERSGLGRTLLVYSLIGSGIYSKMKSTDYYSKYHASTIQKDIEAYYSKANNFNKVSYFLIGSGALVWIYDVYSVTRKGCQNKRNQKKMNENIRLSFSSNQEDIKTISLSYIF